MSSILSTIITTQSCGQMKSQETTDQMNSICDCVTAVLYCTQYILVYTLSSGETESES